MEDAIMESVNAAGDVAETIFNFANLISQYTLWANDHPLLFRTLLIAFVATIIGIPCFIAYKWNRPNLFKKKKRGEKSK